MGEVYHAKDSKLGRDVAIKVLPDELARDEERLRRFRREAKLLASLNHPNIASIYGLEQDGDTHYLVLELVEGETLAERIARGPIPVDEAAAIASKIADALEAAHEQGIVHRDLKPANIKLTLDDEVKVLDFGLAKAFIEEAPDADSSMSPTITRDATRVGVILGTASYMSPEQAKGKRVDKRTDIFAFGAVLCEMLSGKKAFPGEGVSEVLAAVIKSEPDWSLIPRETPVGVKRVLERCLEKDARSRIRDIGDVRFELREALRLSEDPEATARPGRMALAAPLAIGLVLGAAAMRWLTSPDELSRAPSTPAARSVFELPPEAPLALGARVPLIGFDSVSIAISPDGTEIVYVGGSDEGTRLFRRSVGSFEVSEIPGTEGAIHPFFSPDSEWVGFLTADQVKKVRLGDANTGAPETLADARTPIRATWAPDDVIYVAESQGAELSSLPASGGENPVVLYRTEAGTIGSVLPDGHAALLTDMSRGFSGDYSEVVLLDLETLETELLIERGYDARYVPTGHLLFARSGNVHAVSFDLDRREVTGEPVAITSSVAMDSLFFQAQYAISDNGTFVYIPGGDISLGKLAWVDRDGTTEFLPVEERLYNVLDLSPDGRRVAVHVGDVNDYIWIYDLARDEGRRFPAPNAGIPLWTTDGDAIVFANVPTAGVFEQALGSTTPARELTSERMQPYSWGDAGRMLALNMLADWNIVFLDTEDGATRTWESGAERNFWGPAFSPDSRWVAYASDQSGQFEIWIRSFPDGETMQQLSIDYGIEPIWLATGELFYRKGNEWMVTEVTLQPEISWEPPRVVFEATDFIDTKGLSYDVTPDGERLFMVKRTRPPERDKIRVVFDWFTELERVPTDKSE